MGLLANSVSITQYLVKGKLTEPLIERLLEGLQHHSIQDIDGETLEKAVGWTPIDHPYDPDFSLSPFVIGEYIFFSLRLDKKTIPAKILKKAIHVAVARQLKVKEREFLSRNEKQDIRDQVINHLLIKIPANPNIYDVMWHYEKGELTFFSTLKAANEALETLFIKSFDLNLIRLFPYTLAEWGGGLNDHQKDLLTTLAPTRFVE
ncbi:MAG: recombination-associated protein RdgC [Pseudomonadota bacterium]